jgi:uncharacterized protein
VPSIIVDSGPLIALFDPADRYHKQAAEFAKRARKSLWTTTSVVVGEVAAMLVDFQPNLFRFLEFAEITLIVDDRFDEDLPRMIEIMKKYGDLPADLADVSLIALCERRGISAVATIDKDFQVYRLPKGRKFENVFFAAPP